MPVMDGFAATAELRRLGHGLPVVAFTAHALDADRQACAACGCDDYVSKPVDRAGLVAAVSRHARRAAADQAK